METKDYITITISIVALLFSLISLLFVFLNYKRNATKLKIEQFNFKPNPLSADVMQNTLYLDRAQSTELWNIVPILHLILYIKIDNLSYTGITISNLIINDHFLVTQYNSSKVKEEINLCFFASELANNREIETYGHSIPMSATSFEPDNYNLINIGDRIDSKSTVEGVLLISGNTDLYNSVNDGINKLTIVTPDRKFDSKIEIKKTVIPRSKDNYV